jgi:hypothetical protein
MTHPCQTYGQRILAGDMYISTPNASYIQAYIKIFREGSSSPEGLILNWGDNSQDTISGYTATSSTHEGVFVDTYITDHYYNGPGLYEIVLRDSFLVENVANIDHSEDQIFELKQLHRIREDGLPLNYPQFSSSPILIILNESDGALYHAGSFGTGGITSWDSLKTELIPFLDEGYEYPPFTDTIICCKPLIWDRPPSPGRYAFAMEITTWLDGEILGTGVRKTIFDIDESMLVSTYDQHDNTEISLFPNPTSNLLNIQLPKAAKPVQVDVYNTEGQVVYQTVAPRENLDIDVQQWPAGTYFLSLRQKGKMPVVRKFVVTKS